MKGCVVKPVRPGQTVASLEALVADLRKRLVPLEMKLQSDTGAAEKAKDLHQVKNVENWLKMMEKTLKRAEQNQA